MWAFYPALLSPRGDHEAAFGTVVNAGAFISAVSVMNLENERKTLYAAFIQIGDNTASLELPRRGIVRSRDQVKTQQL